MGNNIVLLYKAAADDQKPPANSTCRSQSLGCRNRRNTAIEISTRVVLITSAAMSHASSTAVIMLVNDRFRFLLHVRYCDHHVHKLQRLQQSCHCALCCSRSMFMEFFSFSFAEFNIVNCDYKLANNFILILI